MSATATKSKTAPQSKESQDLAGTIKAKRNRLASLFEAKKQTDGTYDLTAEERDEIKAINTELNDDLCPKWEKAREDARIAEENALALKRHEEMIRRPGQRTLVHAAGQDWFAGHDGVLVGRDGQIKSIGELFIESDGYKAFRNGDRGQLYIDLPDVDIKTLFQTTAGWDPFVARTGRVVLSAQQQPRVVDLLPMSETAYPSIKWMLETTYTNNAAETAQAGTYPESAFALTEQTVAVKKIAVTLPVTDEQLEDEPRSRDYLNNRLTLNLKQRLDLQCLVGNGTGSNLTGILNTGGVQTQAKGTDPAFDAIFKAITLVQAVGFAEPGAVVFHPTDWQNIRLARTADGLYILGNPADAGPERIFGLPRVTTTYETLGTALVGDFAGYCELVYRRGIVVDRTNSHGTEFIEGKERLRASLRVALVVYRPAAYCKVTGL